MLDVFLGVKFLMLRQGNSLPEANATGVRHRTFPLVVAILSVASFALLPGVMISIAGSMPIRSGIVTTLWVLIAGIFIGLGFFMHLRWLKHVPFSDKIGPFGVGSAIVLILFVFYLYWFIPRRFEAVYEPAKPGATLLLPGDVTAISVESNQRAPEGAGMNKPAYALNGDGRARFDIDGLSEWFPVDGGKENVFWSDKIEFTPPLTQRQIMLSGTLRVPLFSIEKPLHCVMKLEMPVIRARVLPDMRSFMNDDDIVSADKDVWLFPEAFRGRVYYARNAYRSACVFCGFLLLAGPLILCQFLTLASYAVTNTRRLPTRGDL